MRQSKEKQWHKNITFARLLAVTMVTTVSIAFLLFGTIVATLQEKKVIENVEKNMLVVLEQYNVYLENHMKVLLEGLKEIESDPNLIQLRRFANNEKELSRTATNYVYMKKMMDQFLGINTISISNVYINFGNGRVATQTYEKDLLKIHYNYQEWADRFSEGRYYWVDANYCRDLVPDPSVGAILFRLYSDGTDNNNGIILIAIKEKFFEDVLNVPLLEPDAGLSLVTEHGIKKYGNTEACEKIDEMSSFLVDRSGKASKSEMLDDYFYVYKKMDVSGWTLVYNVSERSVSNTQHVKRDIIYITIAAIAVVAIFIIVIARKISYSLKALTRTVEAEDVLEHEIHFDTYKEIAVLSNGLETMRKRLKILIGKIESEQEEKRQIELALINEQINPHFLYNTLYSCAQLCEMNQAEKAHKMLSALSAFYRTGLNKGNTIVTVKEELEHAENYLYIQHFRYSDLFDYAIDCAPELLPCKIPKMSLQPLLENAIYHGIKKRTSMGNICIVGTVCDGETACLEVHDDGEGMSSQTINRLKQVLNSKDKGHINECFGLKNVNTRIQFAFGNEYGLELYSVPGDTCVQIRFRMTE